jgi:AcrR family transcriptional regulator
VVQGKSVALARFDSLPAARRDAILLAAAAGFAERGFHRTSYNRLLEKIGLGKSSAYYYFADKADLFDTVLQRAYDAYFENVADLPLPRNRQAFWRYIERLNLRGMEFTLEDPLSARLQQAVLASGEARPSTSGLEAGLKARYQELTRLGRGLGAIRSDLPEELVATLALTLSLTLDDWFMRQGKTTPGQRRRWAKSWTALFERAFGAPRTSPRTRRRPRR